MPKKSIKSQATIQDATRITRTVYFFIAVFALSIVIFDSGNLITRDAVIDRWTLASILLVVNTGAWYISSRAVNSARGAITTALALSLLVFAGFLTYWERGMASTSTILYVLPLLVIATLKNRHALMAFATLAAGTYAFAAVKYFNDFFNEGYRVQLWGSLLFYIGVIYTVAWLIMILSGLRQDSR